jgi:DNA-binding protein YbaB
MTDRNGTIARKLLLGWRPLKDPVGGREAGKMEVIDPAVVAPADVDLLQEPVPKGVQEAFAKGKSQAEAEMKKHIGGFGIH